MVLANNGVYHDFSNTEGAEADLYKVGVIERRKHGEIYFVGYAQVYKT